MDKKKNYWVFVIFVLLIAAIIYALFFRPSFYKFNGGEASLYPTLTERYPSDYQTMTVIGDYIYECNTNGLVKKDTSGTAVWSKAFYIETPLLVKAGKYLAVGDITGKKVYVFDEAGFIRSIDESNELISIHINENGFLTTVMESDKRNIINYYNNEGTKVITRATSYFEDGYPISVASSMDVTRMVTAYLNVNNNRLQSTITFFGFADHFDKKDELIIGGYTYEDSLVNEVIWLDENTLLAIMDNQMVLYECKNEPKVIKVIKLTSELREVTVSDNIFQVLYGKSTISTEVDLSNSVCLYDFNGELINTITFDDSIKTINSTNDGFYIVTSSKIIKYIGKKQEWFASTYLNILELFEIDSKTFLVTTEQGYELLKIREK